MPKIQPADLNAIERASLAGKVDPRRVAVLRTAANFDRPHPNQSPVESLNTKSGGTAPATQNLVKVGGAFVTEIVKHWADWEHGTPP